MIDILTWVDGGVRYYRKITTSVTDVHLLPDGAPPDASWICAADWHALVGEPEVFTADTGEIAVGEDGKEYPVTRTYTTETFEEREAAYLASLGWLEAP